ncbi:hypothetical protein [Pseudoxanthomonas taiwanensis]|uniref:hypothetical protein n=1 Tax=Pseudoxanthomonas taiwanensis TaxID=176598 RepID=UPI00138980F9|nr:hypothetical protein [Pseudoxanthomonas taiwanensis]
MGRSEAADEQPPRQAQRQPRPQQQAQRDSGDARVALEDGSVLPCTRRYRQALRERIEGQGSTATAVPAAAPPPVG